MKTVKVRIPAIVTADGRWAANGSYELVNDPDWSWIDEMCDHEKPTVSPRRYWIEAELPIPETGEIVGVAVADGELANQETTK